MKKLLTTFYKSLVGQTFVSKSTGVCKADFADSFPRVGFLTDKDKADLEEILKIKIKNFAFYEQALVHRSYMHVLKNKDKICFSNERLEFFGDAILEFVVSEHLFGLFVNEFEGALTKMRSNIVSGKSLAICCRELGLEKYLMVSFSAKKNMDAGTGESMVSDMMEAIIGAVYLDNDMNAAREFIINRLLPIVMEKGLMKDTNYKSKFMETVQADGYSSPIYKTEEEIGLPHNRQYKVAAYVDDEFFATGEGKSKKEAEQNAAKNALNNYKKRCTEPKK
jgi:ribonuclease-3